MIVIQLNTTFTESTLASSRKTYNEVKTLTSYYAKTDARIEELRKTINTIHAGTVSLRRSSTACFPWERKREVEAFIEKRDMLPLRLRLTSVPFKNVKSFATDTLTAIFSKSLISLQYTWPSPQ